MTRKFTKLSEITEAMKAGGTLVGYKGIGSSARSYTVEMPDGTKAYCPKTAKNLTGNLTRIANPDFHSQAWTI